MSGAVCPVSRWCSRFPSAVPAPRAPSHGVCAAGGSVTNRGPRGCWGKSRIWRPRSPEPGRQRLRSQTSPFSHGNASPDPSYFESGYFCCCCCFGEGGDRDGSRSLYICYKIFLQTELYTKMYCVHLHVYSGTSKNLNIKKNLKIFNEYPNCETQLAFSNLPLHFSFGLC